MLTFAKIGLVGLVLMSSKMANADPWIRDDYRCHTDIKPLKNSLEQIAECNTSSHFCNKDGWCQLKTTKDTRDDDDDTKDKANKPSQDETDSDDDVTNPPSTTSDCQSVICIDFTSGNRYHPAYMALGEIYRYDTKFVIEKKDQNGRNLYKSIAKNDKKKKPKYAIWWKNGIWMVGDYEKRDTLTAFAVAQSDKKCPEEINYIWRFYRSYDNTFIDAGEGMSVYDKNCE